MIKLWLNYDHIALGSGEEGVGMMLRHVKETVRMFGDQMVGSGVISVPNHFSYPQKQSLLKAAYLADFKVRYQLLLV